MAESMGEAMADVESGRAKTFAALGISLKGVNGQSKDAITGILDLASAVEGMSNSEAVFRIKELGITDNRTVEMVLKGRKELERMLAVQKEQGVITKESAEQAARFTEGMNKLRGALGAVGDRITAALLPGLAKGIEWLTKMVDWAGEHKDLLVGFFGAIAAVVVGIYVPSMIAAAAATIAATLPLLLMGAAIGTAIALFALAYEDIMNFIDGNDSFIGQMAEQYPVVAAMIDMVASAFRTLMEWGGIAFDFLGNAAGMWADGMKAAFDGVIAYFRLVADIWSSVFGGIMSGISKVSSGLSAVGGFLGFGDDEEGAQAAEGVAAGQQALALASASPLNSTTSNSISNSVAGGSKETNVQVGEVVVNTQATDADGIARDVGGSLNNQLKQMNNEFADGVER